MQVCRGGGSVGLGWRGAGVALEVGVGVKIVTRVGLVVGVGRGRSSGWAGGRGRPASRGQCALESTQRDAFGAWRPLQGAACSACSLSQSRLPHGTPGR